VSKKYVDKKLAQEIHDKSQPFIKWLKEAEEEESDSEEEGGDQTIEVNYIQYFIFFIYDHLGCVIVGMLTLCMVDYGFDHW
jgi:hypothetical protein